MALPVANAFAVTLPDTLCLWPWPRHLNPHYRICKKESSEWCEDFKAFSPSAQTAFNKCDINLLACLAYPLLDRGGCRIGCDLMNLFFVIDEHTDVSDIETVRTQAGIVMNAIRNPQELRPEDEWIGGKIAQQFWLNATKLATPTCQSRFVSAFQLYVDAVVEETVDRQNNHIRELDSYLELRRDTMGLKPAFAICELRLNIPDAVMNHPVIMKLTELSIDMLIIGNDIYSYKVESERRDGHNLVTVVMHQFNKDPQEAMDYMSDMHENLVQQFLEEWTGIPAFAGPLDLEVRTYCHGLGNMVRANDSWSFESERYFGKEGPEIRATRRVELKASSTAL